MDFDECKVLPLVYMDLFFSFRVRMFSIKHVYLCIWQTYVRKFRDYPEIGFSQFAE